jgi:hypothetical protein
LFVVLTNTITLALGMFPSSEMGRYGFRVCPQIDVANRAFDSVIPINQCRVSQIDNVVCTEGRVPLFKDLQYLRDISSLTAIW